MDNFNLLPRRFKLRTRRFPARWVLLFLAATLAIVYCGFIIRYVLIKKELAHVAPAVQRLQVKLERAGEIRERRKQIEAETKHLQDLVDTRREWAPVLAGVHEVIPAGTKLTRLQLIDTAGGSRNTTGNQGKPVNIVLEGVSGSTSAVTDFVNKLTALHHFTGVELNSLNVNAGEGMVEFNISARVGKGDVPSDS